MGFHNGACGVCGEGLIAVQFLPKTGSEYGRTRVTLAKLCRTCRTYEIINSSYKQILSISTTADKGN